MLVKIPKKKEDYSVYLAGKLDAKYYIKELGTLLKVKDNTFSIVFYTFSSYRRAYIICDENVNLYKYPYYVGHLPLIKEKVKVLYIAEGRAIDLLKFMCYNMDTIYNEQPYEFNIEYWSKIISIIDISKYTKINKSRRYIEMITNQYNNKRKRLYGTD